MQTKAEDKAKHTRESITAIITIPCAFVGPFLWELSWLSYPLVVSLLKRRRRAKKS